MPDWLVDLGLALTFYAVLAAVTAWFVCALFDSTQPLPPDNSRSDR